MSASEWFLGVACAVGSGLLTGWIRRYAVSRGILDVPNARSSHKQVTPRGGGAAIVLVSMLAFVSLVARDWNEWPLFVSLVVGGAMVALVGFLDDRRPVSPGIRIAAHFAAATLAVGLMGGLGDLQWGTHVVQSGWLGNVLAVFGIVWVINLFNFMDGIDGIAGSEAVFVTLAGSLLPVFSGSTGATSLAGIAVAGSTAGFLFWNWPPARIFMGDVGSGYLGLMIAVLALSAGHENPVAIWVWLVLGGSFFVDATITLLRRVARGEKAYEAHRTHSYQWLSRRWNSHRRVTLLAVLINVAWLLPLAAWAWEIPGSASWIAAAALGPLAVLCLVAGSGRKEGK